MIQKYIKLSVISVCAMVTVGLIFFFYGHSQSIVVDMQGIYTKENIKPILVIGSGCAGCSAGVYGARGNVSTTIIAGGQPGGQLSGTTKVENLPGSTDQLGPDIMQKIQKQAEDFGAEVVYGAVVNVDCSQWPYVVTLEDGRKIYALTIIIATGASPLKLNIPGEQQFWGRGVTTCAICDAPFHKDKDVIVVGGGDSAVEEALQLSAYARTVTIVVRKDSMRAAPSMQNRLKDVASINVLYNTEVTEIGGDEDGVTNVQLYNAKTKETEKRSVSGVFLAIGHTPNSTLFKDCVKTDNDGYIITHGKSQATSMPGIFAAGDVEDRVYRQAGVATGSGIRAALDALEFLQENGFNAALAKKLESHYFTNKKASTDKEHNASGLVSKVASTEEFDLLRTKQRMLVVDFYTNFCPSCKFMMPAYEKVAFQLKDKATFVKANADEVMELSQRYKIVSVPTLLIFKDGELVGRRNEAISEAELIEFVQNSF